MITPRIIDLKGLARDHAKLLRKQAAETQPLAGQHAASCFMRYIDPPKDAKIALYVPFGSELDTWPLAEALAIHGATICLPVVIKKNTPLIFRTYEADIPLIDGIYGIKTPPETAREIIPDFIVTPLTGFKRDGSRLGMGGGFYDRTLEKLRADGDVCAIAYAYALQEIKTFKADKHDQPMDWIITEREGIKVSQL